MSRWTPNDTLIVIVYSLAGLVLISYWRVIAWAVLIILLIILSSVAIILVLFRRRILSSLDDRVRQWTIREAAKREQARIRALQPKILNIEQTFSAQTPANFSALYSLQLVIEAPNEMEYNKSKLFEGETR